MATKKETTEMQDSAPKIYKALNQVMAELAKGGIGKNNKNTQQGYSFRGIDDVYNALSSKLSEAQIIIIPRVIEKTVREVTNKNGTILFYTSVNVEYDLISSEDGSKHTASMFGEAMDSGDKSCNKAISAAFKYLAFQLFCIPTEGSNDADYHTHEIKAPSLEEGIKDALTKLAKCNTVQELSLLKSTLPSEVVSSPRFQEAGKLVYESLKNIQ